MKEREFTFSATFSLPSPSSDLKVPYKQCEEDAKCCSFIDGITKPVTECYLKMVVISSNIGNLLQVAKLGQCIIIITLCHYT